MSHAQYVMQSEIGPLYLVASEKGLAGVFWKKQVAPQLKELSKKNPEVLILKKAIQQLEEYFAGKRKDFDLPFDMEGTDFQKKVWQALSRIPYGETCSYRDIARKIKNEKAFRAVGTANGKNPMSIIVPCHRVIAANGTLGGYAGGVAIKQKLLDLESLDCR
jgi:methylated-DNA-[protein]-cysteine S-methyltransferase